MSYVQVESVEETISKAKKLGGIIEFINLENPFGRIALIRDTLGAGFTIYEGNQLNSKTISKENTLIFNELHVSNAKKAIAFYKGLFNWSFQKIDDFSYTVYCHSSKEKIAVIHQIDTSIKGKYEYWVCVFGVKNLTLTIEKIKNNHGTIISDEANRVLCSDGSEAFFYIQKV